MRAIFQAIGRVFGWIDNLEVGIVSVLGLLAVVAGPLVIAVIALRLHHFGIAAAIGIPWLAVLGRAGWELRRGRVVPVTAGLALLWLIVTVILGCLMN